MNRGPGIIQIASLPPLGRFSTRMARWCSRALKFYQQELRAVVPCGAPPSYKLIISIDKPINYRYINIYQLYSPRNTIVIGVNQLSYLGGITL